MPENRCDGRGIGVVAISRALRFEILRRDGFACTYCGRKPPDVVLHVDHVMPVALGGSDEATNLATACQECNAGKSSTAPDGPTVAEIDERNRRWRQAVALAAAESLVVPDEVTACFCAVQEEFGHWLTLGAGERRQIQALMDDGLPAEAIVEAATLARRNGDMPYMGEPRWFGYMLAVCRNKLAEIHRRAAEIMGEAEGGAS